MVAIELKDMNYRYQKMVCEYDLISENVNKIMYQPFVESCVNDQERVVRHTLKSKENEAE
jgi:hypothetical protein